ncbi:hypothetical protein D3C85_1898680 [compost metagenome]
MIDSTEQAEMSRNGFGKRLRSCGDQDKFAPSHPLCAQIGNEIFAVGQMAGIKRHATRDFGLETCLARKQPDRQEKQV